MRALPYGLKIIIEGKEGHGKTMAALAIQAALKNLGAWVAIKDQGEVYYPDTGYGHHDRPRTLAEPLTGTDVIIHTKCPDDD